jgi:hypothetical protein
LRISNFARKKPSNVRVSTKNILTFDGLASPLELQAELSRETALWVSAFEILAHERQEVLLGATSLRRRYPS